MVIIDTSVWIEFFKGNEPHKTNVKNLLEEMRVIGIECIFGELLQGIKNKREKDIITAYWNSIKKADEKNLFIEAGIYSANNHLISKGVGLIDAAILIAASRHNARIYSLDAKLNSICEKNIKFLLH